MREILFRAKDNGVLNGVWQYGSLDISYPDAPTIVRIDRHNNKMFVPILIETVGQYTGLTDKNGNKIFEGDIVKAQDDVFGSPFDFGIVGKIVYEETAYFIETQNIVDTQYLFNECAVYEVIGNIHDNPEL